MSGTVTSAKPFKAAQVYIRNVDMRIMYMVFTNAGQFRAVSLFPGNYEISVTAKGFKSVLIPKGSHQAIRMLLKNSRDQTEENYLVVRVHHEGKSVLAGLREAYWRHWEGHYIPEFRVTIREMNEKPHPPPPKRP